MDFCAVGARPTDTDNCVPLTAEERWCVRALAARTDAGRGYLDQLARMVEIQFLMTSAVESRDLPAGERQQLFLQELESTLVGLAGPDAAPSPGKVGYWAGDTSDVFATVLANGHRLFLRRDGDVFSTNSGRMLLPGQAHKLTIF
jgi:hypothetical protein